MQPQSSYETPNLRELLNVLFERKLGMTLVFLTTFGITCVLIFFVLSPKYEAKATLLVNFTDVARPLVNAPPKSDFEKITDFHTQKDIIKSENLARQTVLSLKLGEKRAISNIERTKIYLKEIQNSLGHALGIERWTKPWDPEAAAIFAVVDNLDSQTSPESRALKLTYRAYSPQEAADTLAKLIERYEAFYYEQIRDEAKGILNYLQTQIDDSLKALTAAEEALLEFKRQASIPEIGQRNASSVNRYSTVNITDSVAVQDEIKLYILQLENELRQLRQQFPESDPRVKTVREKLAGLINAINQLPEKELTLHRLKRNFELNQEKYMLMAKNLEQAKLIAVGQANNLGLIRVLEAPAPDDNPVSPKKRLILILSVFLSIGLSLAWAYLGHFFDHSVRSPADFARYHNIRCLGSLGEVS